MFCIEIKWNNGCQAPVAVSGTCYRSYFPPCFPANPVLLPLIPLETKLQNNWGGDREHWATTEAIFSLDTVCIGRGLGFPFSSVPLPNPFPFSGCVNPVNSTSPKPHLWLYLLRNLASEWRPAFQGKVIQDLSQLLIESQCSGKVGYCYSSWKIDKTADAKAR